MDTCYLKNNISLIGMMGSGKSTTAKALAELMPNLILLETDFEIEKLEKLTISQIFSQKGEEYFRQCETTLLKNLKTKTNLIISTGGGMFLKEINRNLLCQNSLTFYLSASPTTIFERIKNDTNRPLLNCENPQKKIAELINEREKYYKLAKIEIITDNKTPFQAAEEILEIYKKYGK